MKRLCILAGIAPLAVVPFGQDAGANSNLEAIGQKAVAAVRMLRVAGVDTSGFQLRASSIAVPSSFGARGCWTPPSLLRHFTDMPAVSSVNDTVCVNCAAGAAGVTPAPCCPTPLM